MTRLLRRRRWRRRCSCVISLPRDPPTLRYLAPLQPARHPLRQGTCQGCWLSKGGLYPVARHRSHHRGFPAAAAVAPAHPQAAAPRHTLQNAGGRPPDRPVTPPFLIPRSGASVSLLGVGFGFFDLGELHLRAGGARSRRCLVARRGHKAVTLYSFSTRLIFPSPGRRRRGHLPQAGLPVQRR